MRSISEVECPTPEKGRNSTLRTLQSKYTYMDKVEFQCDEPYPMVYCGSLNLTCLETGVWSDHPPDCCKLFA